MHSKTKERQVLVLTNYQKNTKHARLEYEMSILTDNGFHCTAIHCGDAELTISQKIKTLIYLKFVNVKALEILKKEADNYDLIFLYGLQCLLPLNFLPAALRQKCIYQTLNHDVTYHVYELAKRSLLLKNMASIIHKKFFRKEQKLSQEVKSVIVNSASLNELFPHSTLIYYTSPLEGDYIAPKPELPFAYIYLGQLREEKIAPDFFNFINRGHEKFFICGILRDNYIKKQVESSDNSIYLGNFQAQGLITKITELRKNYNLIGISLIQEPHRSYSSQNANKDIDYLALQIPILGNTRNTTRELVETGSGFFYHEFNLSKIDFPKYVYAVEKCKEHYKTFNNNNFKQKFLAAFNH